MQNLSCPFFIKKIFKPFSREEILFLLCAMAYGFLISLEYGITRPAGNCVFLSLYGSSFFPYAWVATVPINFYLVGLYNRYLPKWGCLKTFSFIVFFVIAINTLCAFYLKEMPALSFFQYIWKDIYILLMFKQLWSLIHSTVSTERAKFFYGLIFGAGGIGSIIGSIVPGFFAVMLGSVKLFLFTAPIYLLLLYVYAILLKHSGENAYGTPEEAAKPKGRGYGLIGRSPLLILALLVVLGMQIGVAFIDYNYNYLLERSILDLDLRTEYTGRLVGLTNIISTSLQFAGVMLVIHFFGLKKTHLMVPIILCLSCVLFLVMPTFAIVSASYVIIKTLDYSIFSVAREMLYIPMKTDEKFRAKAIIDVFVYRTAKAVASLFLLGISYLPFAHSTMISWVSIAIFIGWALAVTFMFKYYEAPVVV